MSGAGLLWGHGVLTAHFSFLLFLVPYRSIVVPACQCFLKSEILCNALFHKIYIQLYAPIEGFLVWTSHPRDQLQNTRPLFCIALNNKSAYCVMPGSIKRSDTSCSVIRANREPESTSSHKSSSSQAKIFFLVRKNMAIYIVGKNIIPLEDNKGMTSIYRRLFSKSSTTLRDRSRWTTTLLDARVLKQKWALFIWWIATSKTKHQEVSEWGKNSGFEWRWPFCRNM